MADLHPTVISPLEHVYKAVKYTCAGEGLRKDDYFYDPQAEKFVRPKNEKPGVGPKEKKSVSWWKAQCAFRGLNQSGSMTDLQTRLKESKKKMLPELKSVESVLNKEFKKQIHAARGNSWESLKTAEAKAKSNPRRFLLEVFPNAGGSTGRPADLDIVVLKLGNKDHLGISTAADELGLETVSVDAPWTSSKRPSPARFTVIGRIRDAVWNRMREIEREASRSRQTYAPEAEKPQKSKSSSEPSKAVTTSKLITSVRNPEHVVVSSKPPRTKQIARTWPDYEHLDEKSVNQRRISTIAAESASMDNTLSNTSPAPRGRTKQTARKRAYPDSDDEQESMRVNPSDNSWDVCGSWEISCLNIEQEWSPLGKVEPGKRSPLDMQIYLENQNGRRQLFAIFHFRIVEGIMRFEKPIPVPKSEPANINSQKRKREDEDVNIHDGSYQKKSFLLGASDKPTARRSTWQYRWRGMETGMGEIQLGSDSDIHDLTFSNKGTELSGTIRVPAAGVCEFTGHKLRTRSHSYNSRRDAQATWEEYSEQAHEIARVSRWR